MNVPTRGHGSCPVGAGALCRSAAGDGPVSGCPGAQVRRVLTRGVEQLAELPRGLSGVGEVCGGLVDGPAGVEVVVGPDPAGLLFGGQPAAQLP